VVGDVKRMRIGALLVVPSRGRMTVATATRQF